MTNVKFRGKRKDNGEWIYGNLVILKNNGIKQYYIINLYDMTEIDEFTDEFESEPRVKLKDLFIEVIPETVGRFTGFKDKNKIEVYEHDIIDQGDNYPSIVRYGYDDWIETIGFYLEERRPKYVRGPKDYPRYHAFGSYTTIPKDMEVLGTIFDDYNKIVKKWLKDE